MKKGQKSILVLLAIFVVLLSTTLYVSFSSNLDEQEVIVKSVTPVYDENSTVVVEKNNVAFNDKNQTVDYKVIIENTQNYDVKITDIKLTTPTEEFLTYEVKDIEENDVLTANSTKELTVSFETTGIKGWGRNFADELTANIEFNKLPMIEETPSVPEKDDTKSEDDNDTDNESDSVDKEDVKIDLDTSLDKEYSKQENNKEEQKDVEDEDDVKVENPYTSDKGVLFVLIAATTLTGLVIIVVSKSKFAKYTVFILILSPALTITSADEILELPLKFNISFKSQNVMKPSGLEYASYTLEFLNDSYGVDYWAYARQIKNFYIQNEITEIDDYAYEFDVTENKNGRVMAYLVESKDNSVCTDFEENEALCYDLYLQADGLIYPNKDASYYFAAMEYLDKIDNLAGIDTSEVINMKGMFNGTSVFCETFTLDLSSFNTSNVTDMSHMFTYTGDGNQNFVLDLSSFDTSNVVNMSHMFYATGENIINFKLNLGDNFDTSNVKDMSSMFNSTGFMSTEFTLDLGDKFDTSKVTDMSEMFSGTGYRSSKLNFSITIKNQNITSYSNMFQSVATKTGSLITVNFTKETESLVDQMITTKSSSSKVVKGGLIVDVDNLSIGDEIHISSEKFNVISETDDTVTMLAQYNLGTDYRQSTIDNGVMFADAIGWEYTPGPKEIDIRVWSINLKTYINEYVNYLQAITEDTSSTGNLITLTELKGLGCTISDDYEYHSGHSCSNSSYNSWLVNGQTWWTRSASSTYSYGVWYVNSVGHLGINNSASSRGVRPVITISKEVLKGL